LALALVGFSIEIFLTLALTFVLRLTWVRRFL
jgi:hypothetical protein